MDGLEPTLKSIKFTKKILVANKEAIICGWNLIDKELKKYKTKFIPVDSEHFSFGHYLTSTHLMMLKNLYYSFRWSIFEIT